MVELRYGRRALWLAATTLAVVPALARGQDGAIVSRGTVYAPPAASAASDTLPPPVAREFRAVWIATVANIDWPSRPGLPVDSQKAELRRILDRAAQLRLNAIVFQIRPSADALYASRLEPWSFFLTGAMGRAPSPFYDPLEFAITEAHARGMELHAWFNPYRARHPRDTTRNVPGLHVSRARPSQVKRYGPFEWMDPGEPAVRRLTTDVILDVVRRYDVDGVHIDDYFYPYPELRNRREIPFPDDRSWAAYQRGGGKLSRNDWRRQNVDLLVQELHEGIRRTKPWVKFGISPFGIWRPGHPPSVRGLDPFDKLYADSRRWLLEGWLDYWTPQLYWRTTAPQQRYADLLAWWREQNVHQRHVWPGNYTGRASAMRSAGLWPVREIFDQIQETRRQLGPVSGNVHFSMDAFMVNRDSLVERLRAGLYAEPALVPASPWLGGALPEAPVIERRPAPRWVELAIRPGGVPVVHATAPAPPPPSRPDRTATARPEPPAEGSAKDPLWWLVRTRYADGWYARIVPATTTAVRLPLDQNDAPPRVVVVTTIDRTGLESLPTFLR